MKSDLQLTLASGKTQTIAQLLPPLEQAHLFEAVTVWIVDLIAGIVGMMLVQQGRRHTLDWHGQRSLSFLQLGLRECARLSYHRLMLPLLKRLPRANPPPACASKRKRETLDTRIEFSKVVRFSA